MSLLEVRSSRLPLRAKEQGSVLGKAAMGQRVLGAFRQTDRQWLRLHVAGVRPRGDNASLRISTQMGQRRARSEWLMKESGKECKCWKKERHFEEMALVFPSNVAQSLNGEF